MHTGRRDWVQAPRGLVDGTITEHINFFGAIIHFISGNVVMLFESVAVWVRHPNQSVELWVRVRT